MVNTRFGDGTTATVRLPVARRGETTAAVVRQPAPAADQRISLSAGDQLLAITRRRVDQ